jgi:hypothetical protein
MWSVVGAKIKALLEVWWDMPGVTATSWPLNVDELGL